MRLRESPLGWAGLRAVFISHLHGDHVLGLPGLLMSLGMARRKEPLAIFGPEGIEELLQAFLNICGVSLPFETQVHAIPRRPADLYRGADYTVGSAPLQHRTLCFGFFWREDPRPGRFYLQKAEALGVPRGPLYRQLQTGVPVGLPDGRTVQPGEVLGPPRPGRLIAYCTDTLPCSATVRHARSADLLIHDSTFLSEHEHEAAISGHSTARQAAQIALHAGCFRLALTHVSVRYESDAPLLDEARAVFPNSFVAEDLLRMDVPTRDE